MPFREHRDLSGFTEFSPPPEAPQPGPTLGETFAAGFRLENDVLNAVDLMTRPAFDDDLTFDLPRWLKENNLWDYRDNFVGVRGGEPEALSIAARIKEEEEDKRIISDAGWAGTTALFAAGMVSPTLALPVAAGGRGLVAFGRAATLGAVAGGLQELPLQAAQETRTGAESAFSIGASTIVGGLLGGVAASLTREQLDGLARGLQADMAISSRNIAIPQAAGAAPTRGPDPGKFASGLGAVDLLSRMSPVMRVIQQDRSSQGRYMMSQMADAGLVYAKAGAVVAPMGTVENLALTWYGRFAKAVESLDENYLSFVYDGAVPNFAPNLRAVARGSLGSGPKSKALFREEVGKAMRARDEHQNPYVAATAKAYRQEVYEPILKEAQALGVISKDLVDTLGDPSYLFRDYDRRAVQAYYDEFIEILKANFEQKLVDEFSKKAENFKKAAERDEELIEAMRLGPEEVEEQRAFLQEDLKDLEEGANTQHLNALEEAVAQLRSAARDLRGGSAQDEALRRQMLADAKDMEKAGGEPLASLKTKRSEVRRRLRNLNQAQVVLEDKYAAKLEKIERSEELSLATLKRVVKKASNLISKLEGLSDEAFDKQIESLKGEFMRVGAIYDRGEERIQKLLREDMPKPKPTLRGNEVPIGGGKLPERGVVVANVYENGKVYIGKPGEVHFQLSERYPHKDRGDPTFTGFMNPDGELLTREEAFAWVNANEKRVIPDENMAAGQLDALDYREQVSPARQAKRQFTPTERLFAADQLQEGRANRLTEIANQLDEAENLDRASVRELLEDGIEETLLRANDIVGRRAVRAERLKTAVKGMAPEAVEARIQSVRERRGVKIREFEDRTRERGADYVDVTSGVADFSRTAKEAAESVAQKILGTQLRLPAFEVMQGERGAELARVLDIPSQAIEKFLVNDVEKVTRSYLRTMAPDLEMTRKFGSVNAEEQFDELLREESEQKLALKKRLTEENAAKAKPLSPEALEEKLVKEQLKISDEYAGIRRDLSAVVGRIRHTWGLPDDPDGIAYRMGRVAMNLNVLRMMGGVTVSSIPDLARPVMKYGLTRTFKDGFLPLITNFKQLKLTKRELRLAGGALDVILHSRSKGLFDLMDELGRGTKFERGVEFATNKMGIVALFDYWTSAMKQLTGSIANVKILDDIRSVVEGTGNVERATRDLASLGIDGFQAEDIWKEIISGGGEKVNGVWMPNTEAWKNDNARRSYRSALLREVNNAIVTPGVERPLWMDKNLGGRLISQFKGFTMSSTSKVLLAGLQRDRGNFAVGSLISLGLGALGYYIYAMAAGDKVQEEMMNAGIDKWADEAIDRSGLLGVLSLGLDAAQRIPATQPYASFSGGRSTRRGGQSLIEALLGPTFDLGVDTSKVLSEFDDPTQSTIHTVRSLAPLQNVFYLRQPFTAIEEAVNKQLSIPERRQ